jgi:predicted ATPase
VPEPVATNIRIFLSYRRDDVEGYAGRLFDALKGAFRPEHVFRDVEAIAPGVDYVEAIDTAVASCDVLLVLIGRRWLDAADESGRRLDNPDDVLRSREVEAALAHQVRVIPVLVHGAQMPRPDELPEPLRPLHFRRALELSDARWEYDVGRLIETLGGAVVADGVGESRRFPELPGVATSLVGRERELEELRAMVVTQRCRLVTLIGPGGIGKTRLALALARTLADEFGDGVCFVDLAPLTDAALVVPTIAQALSLTEGVPGSLLETIKDRLRDQRALLVLDNFEQVAEAAQPLADLLSACEGVQALVTSRSPLHLAGEHEYAVPSLSVPDLTRLGDLESVARNESVELFTERARAVKRGFALTEKNAPAVAEICARLDGLPLAIELAAARVRMLPPQVLLDRLEQRLVLLTGGPRDAPVRQQTLRSAIDWSYTLLKPEEQSLFERLAVFVGGCTLEGVEAVCSGDNEHGSDLFDGLASLVENSLLRQEEGAEGAPRFSMLATIREYALERLQASDAFRPVSRRHAEYYLAFAEQANVALRNWARPSMAPHQRTIWYERVELELDNLRASLTWAGEEPHDAFQLRLAVALARFWNVRGHLSEGRRWLADSLASNGKQPPTLRAAALYLLSDIGREQGDYARALELAQESLALYREHQDIAGCANALRSLGYAYSRMGDVGRATTYLEQCIAAARESGSQENVVASIMTLGYCALQEGDYERAIALVEESLAAAPDDLEGIAIGRFNLALARLGQRRYEEAGAQFESALGQSHELGLRSGVAYCLHGLAAVAASNGAPERAASLSAAAEALRERIGITLEPVERRTYESTLRTIRGELAAQDFDAAWNAGSAMNEEEAVMYALAT